LTILAPSWSTDTGNADEGIDLVSGLRFRVSGLRFWALGFRFWILGFVFQVSGFGFRVPGSGIRVPGSGFRISIFGFQGFKFRILGVGFRVPGCDFFDFEVSGPGFQVSGFKLRVLGSLREPEAEIAMHRLRVERLDNPLEHRHPGHAPGSGFRVSFFVFCSSGFRLHSKSWVFSSKVWGLGFKGSGRMVGLGVEEMQVAVLEQHLPPALPLFDHPRERRRGSERDDREGEAERESDRERGREGERERGRGRERER